MSGKKGAPALTKLLQIAKRHEQHRETYLAVKQQQAWLRQIERMLEPEITPPYVPSPERAAEAAWALWSFLLSMERQAHEQPIHQAFVAHVKKWTTNIGQGLYACFAEPRLPRTNNGMERFLRTLKGQHRRITGRRSWNQYVLRYGAYVAFQEGVDSPTVLLPRLKGVSYPHYRAERNQWQVRLAPERRRARYRRNPSQFLKDLEANWK